MSGRLSTPTSSFTPDRAKVSKAYPFGKNSQAGKNGNGNGVWTWYDVARALGILIALLALILSIVAIILASISHSKVSKMESVDVEATPYLRFVDQTEAHRVLVRGQLTAVASAASSSIRTTAEDGEIDVLQLAMVDVNPDDTTASEIAPQAGFTMFKKADSGEIGLDFFTMQEPSVAAAATLAVHGSRKKKRSHTNPIFAPFDDPNRPYCLVEHSPGNGQILRISTQSNFHRVGIHMGKQHEPEATLDINGDLSVRAGAKFCGCLVLSDGYEICDAGDLTTGGGSGDLSRCDANIYCPSTSPLECHEYSCIESTIDSQRQCVLTHIVGCTPAPTPAPTPFPPGPPGPPGTSDVRACTPAEIDDNCVFDVEPCQEISCLVVNDIVDCLITNSNDGVVCDDGLVCTVSDQCEGGTCVGIDFNCSEGTDGPQGPQGPQGANGTDGMNGFNGTDGMTGPQGPTGDRKSVV